MEEKNNIENYVFESNGRNLGFIRNSFLYSRDGEYLGWLEEKYVWDKEGFFRGISTILNGKKYILKDKFRVPPTRRTPKETNNIINPPDPPQNLKVIDLPVGIIDGF